MPNTFLSIIFVLAFLFSLLIYTISTLAILNDYVICFIFFSCFVPISIQICLLVKYRNTNKILLYNFIKRDWAFFTLFALFILGVLTSDKPEYDIIKVGNNLPILIFSIYIIFYFYIHAKMKFKINKGFIEYLESILNSAFSYHSGKIILNLDDSKKDNGPVKDEYKYPLNYINFYGFRRSFEMLLHNAENPNPMPNFFTDKLYLFWKGDRYYPCSKEYNDTIMLKIDTLARFGSQDSKDKLKEQIKNLLSGLKETGSGGIEDFLFKLEDIYQDTEKKDISLSYAKSIESSFFMSFDRKFVMALLILTLFTFFITYIIKLINLMRNL